MENVNVEVLISMARSMVLLKIDIGCHDESFQYLSVIRYSLDLKWTVNDEIKVENQRTYTNVGDVLLVMVSQD